MASPQSVASVHHLHPIGDTCPTCDQPIPHDRAEEIARRLDEQERRRAAALRAKLQDEFALKLAEFTEQARLESADEVAKARTEAKTAADAAAQEKIASATAGETAAKQALEAKTAEAQAANTAAAETQAEFAEQLAQSKRDADTQLAQARTEAAENLVTVKAEATRAANTAAAAQVQQAQDGKAEAEAASLVLRAQLDASAKVAEDAIALATSEAAVAADARVGEAEAARQAAETQTKTAVGNLETLKANQEASLSAALKEQRDALEADRASAINAERSAAFEEKQKLSERLEGVQRQLDKKTAEELGEGAEIDLFETLKGGFEGDLIVRVKKGLPGADIVQTVVHNGQICGKIIYDSKNHSGWRTDFITKLRADQLAEGAEHAILTVMKFPAGARQLHLQDGVLIANPARVLAVVELMRRHMVQSHTLRMSAQQRAEKTAALYTFITSEQCAGILERLEGFSQTLLDIQDAERSAHDRVWKQQGLAIRGSQKVQAELRNEIDSIIGTLSAPESQP